MRATQKQREEFIVTLLSHLPKLEGIHWSRDGYPFAKRLMRYGATLAGIAERECNGHQTWDGRWDEKAAKRDELKEARIRARVEKLCAEFGCQAVFSGDPRGATLKIHVPDGFANDWGKEGICVPTS